MRIFADFLITFDLAFRLDIVLFDFVEKAVALLARERRRFGLDGIQQDFATDLHVAVIGEREHGVGEMKSVEILEATQADKPGDVAVGDEVHRPLGIRRRIVVVVFHDHQHVAALDLLFGTENITANPFVVTVRPLVRPGDDDHLVAAVTVEGILQLFHEITTLYRLEIRVVHFEFRYFVDTVFEHAAHQRSIEQNTRLHLLAHHLVHQPVDDFAVARNRRRIERRTEIAPDGRQLRAVADQNQPATASAAHVTHQVFQQRSAAEQCAVARRIGEHRGFVHDEDGTLFPVEVEREFRFVIGVGALAVDAFVDRKRLLPAVAGEHFGRPSGRSEQHGLYS